MAAVEPPRPLLEADDRSRFNCGRNSINAWFHERAWTNHMTGVSRVSVICDAETGDVIGFVCLSAAQIERAFLPKPRQRNKPDPFPATLLGQLAVHIDRQGEGHARSLLHFALTTAVIAARQVGSFGVMTHPIDDGVRAFYRRWSFTDLPFDPRRTMIVRMADLEEAGFGH